MLDIEMNALHLRTSLFAPTHNWLLLDDAYILFHFGCA